MVSCPYKMRVNMIVKVTNCHVTTKPKLKELNDMAWHSS